MRWTASSSGWGGSRPRSTSAKRPSLGKRLSRELAEAPLGRAQGLGGDPRAPRDQQVRYKQQGGSLEPAPPSKGKQGRGLHLDRDRPPVGPILLVVTVVEEVGGNHRAGLSVRLPGRKQRGKQAFVRRDAP